MSFLLGLDVGTTGCKAVIFDFEGNIKGYGFQEYEILYRVLNGQNRMPVLYGKQLKRC